ncbi:potassium transporter Kup [candidate division KSB3 bacterium]|uniref:Potassium transporter Kup n=1 Tax=candidate division KSB3 bacterium TaxID=2044937 RepID=A0A2G6KAM6_9BACT|nr:MAG: potassium transporter Kup [candidate division KSB3 bacterium]
MRKRFAVIGLGVFGRTLTKTLTQLGAEVIAIDNTQESIEEIGDDALFPVQMDGTDQEALEAQDIKDVDAAIVAMGDNFEEALLTVVTLKQKIGVPKVIARARTSIRKEILEQVGCDRVVLPEEEMAHNLGKELISGLFVEQIEISKNYSIAHLVAPEEFAGKQIVELQLRETYDINIVAVKRKVPHHTLLGKETEKTIVMVPKPDDTIVQNDLLVVFGHDKNLGRLASIVKKD